LGGRDFFSEEEHKECFVGSARRKKAECSIYLSAEKKRKDLPPSLTSLFEKGQEKKTGSVTELFRREKETRWKFLHLGRRWDLCEIAQVWKRGGYSIVRNTSMWSGVTGNPKTGRLEAVLEKKPQVSNSKNRGA